MTFQTYLSPPYLSGNEGRYLDEALASGWLVPMGPTVDRFEREFAAVIGAEHAVATASGTAALHLAMIAAGVGPGDEVIVPTLTFIATANPAVYLAARPVFLDCDAQSWNLDVGVLEDFLRSRAAVGRVPKALALVHLYGQTADLDSIVALCARYGVVLLEDAAEALGSTYRGRSPGLDGLAGVFSFNGNKIISTAGGGMLVTRSASVAALARKLATQAREPALHYEHHVVGFNYRLSNLCAAVGSAQLETLAQRVQVRRQLFSRYAAALGNRPGVKFQEEMTWGTHTRWLTTLTIEPKRANVNRDDVIASLAKVGIESRPLWKPLHLQPVFRGAEYFGGGNAESLFRDGICLPSGPQVTDEVFEHVAAAFGQKV
jgi:dTDP-4-amino-4,6-dideoxygalactose transaminase